MKNAKQPNQGELETLFQHYQNNDNVDGEKLANSIIEKFPNHQFAWKILAAILNRTGRVSKAITAYKKAVELDPQDYEAYNNLGKAFQHSGRFEEAEKNLRKALTLKPDYVEALYNLANTLNQTKMFKESIVYYRKVIEIMPNSHLVHNNFGAALQGLKKYEQAENSFRKALEINPEFFQALCNLSSSLNSLGRNEEAIEACKKSLKINPDYSLANRNMAKFLMSCKFKKYIPDMPEIILKILNTKNIINPYWLSSSVISLIKLDPVIIDNMNKVSSDKFQVIFEEILISLSNVPLLLKLIESSSLNDLELENFLKKIRSIILINISKIENNAEILRLQISLSKHCYLNEYLYDQKSEEAKALKELESLVKKNIINGHQPNSNELAALASYKALNEYAWIHSIKIPIELEPLKTQQILEPAEEKRIKTEIPILGNVANDISVKVQKQYEDNPYPRWISTGLTNERGSIASLIELLNLRVADSSISKVIAPEILIAGCGTGQQIIGSIDRFDNCKILAIDLSMNSLAYSKRKTKEFSNIEYMQADILNLGMLNRKFDIIECCGVLHHMEDPIKGWKTLTSLLKPGGIMKIALYSKLARKHILEIRNEIKKLNINPDNNSMKVFRNYVINSKENKYKKLATSTDFYSISTFRDLIFHVQEHQFSLAQIKINLDKLGLIFCGLDNWNIDQIKNNFKLSNPLNSDIYDLEKWISFEEKNEDVFAGMYQFWCQKS